MTRLRYKKESNGNFKSCPVLLGNGYVFVRIFPRKALYKIIRVDDLEVVNEGKANTIKDLKKKAKDSLKLLGVAFFDNVVVR